MAPPRKCDYEKIIRLRDLGLKPGEIAERLGVKPSHVYDAVRTFKIRAGMIQPRATPAQPVRRPQVQEDDRPGVLVINVPCAKYTTDGTIKHMPVSLPRLSILDGWTGRA